MRSLLARLLNVRVLIPTLMLAATGVVAHALSAGTAKDQSPAHVAPPVSAHRTTTDHLTPLSSAPEVILGDRLFFETRFAQFFFERCKGDVNARLPKGDPVVDEVASASGKPLDGPFGGQSMNCRQCHLGDDFLFEEQLAGRTYCDFSRRSPIPRRADGLTATPRNSPLTVNLGLPGEAPMLLHFDGEFATAEDLVIDTLTGRNFGWLPTEAPLAVAHVAKVIRGDRGLNPRQMVHERAGVPYRVAMLGTDPSLPASFRIPPAYRLDVDKASDDQILLAVAKLMHVYMDSLRFGTTNTGRESASPYDVFLEKNGLPAKPNAGESKRVYARRLLTLVGQRDRWQWVTDEDGEFELHSQDFRFGETELRGLKTFFAEAGDSPRAHVGNCVACHAPPHFTDHRLHNNGVSQAQYDAVFGAGAFAALDIPDLAKRNAEFNAYLPASSRHPKATARFRSAPSADKPGHADLGVWNIFANPDVPKPQAALTQILCESPRRSKDECTPAAVLPLTIARFKTPSIRDLGQSNPYFHSGALDSVEDVLRFYVTTSSLARAGKVRNGAPELSGVQIDATDIAPLAAFLRALNEDYQ